MVHLDLNWLLFFFVTLIAGIYMRWLAQSEPGRLRRQAEVKRMHRLYAWADWLCQMQEKTPRDVEPCDATARETLDSLFAYSVQEYRQARSRFRMALLGTLMLFFLISLLLHLFEYGGLPMVILCVTLPALLRRLEMRRQSERRMHNVLTVLQKYEPGRSVGALIEAMRTGNETTYRLASDSLIAELARLQASDGLLLTARQRVWLCRALHGSHSELILAIVRAFERIGDAKAIPHVKRLTNCPVWLAEYDRIQEAARHCLPILQARAAEAQTARTYLRAATPPAAPEKVLLRPAPHEESASSALLVRASMPNARVHEDVHVKAFR